MLTNRNYSAILATLQKQGSENGRVVTIGMFTVFRKAPPSVVSGYGKRSINLNKVVANFEKHIFLSQTVLTRTGIISNCKNEMFEA
jgi:hypothetical protein